VPWAILSLKLPIPARIPILYVILGVLVAISVVPMYFYSAKMESINRDRLKTNEMLLQNTVTRSLADDLSQHEASLRMMLANLSAAIQISSAGDIEGDGVETAELRALLENFVSSSDDVAYATLLNTQAKGISAGRIAPDAFLRRELERGFAAAREGRAYNGQALVVGSGHPDICKSNPHIFISLDGQSPLSLHTSFHVLLAIACSMLILATCVSVDGSASP